MKPKSSTCLLENISSFCLLSLHGSVDPANTTRLPNAGSMLAHRLRRWPIIDPALGKRVVFAGRWGPRWLTWRWVTLLPLHLGAPELNSGEWFGPGLVRTVYVDGTPVVGFGGGLRVSRCGREALCGGRRGHRFIDGLGVILLGQIGR